MDVDRNRWAISSDFDPREFSAKAFVETINKTLHRNYISEGNG
jgi:hypothetical protein